MTRVILTGNKDAYIDGYDKVLLFNQESIQLLCKKQILHIYGENLCIDKYSQEALVIKGEIKSINWQ